MNATRREMGRPTLYSNELAAEICERISNGESLRSVCDDARMPSRRIVMYWLGEHDKFREMYRMAREVMFEEIPEIADTPMIGKKVTTKADGTVETVEGDNTERSRLRIEARKWYLSKLAPRKYGDKLDVAHTVSPLEELVRRSYEMNNKESTNEK